MITDLSTPSELMAVPVRKSERNSPTTPLRLPFLSFDPSTRHRRNFLLSTIALGWRYTTIQLGISISRSLKENLTKIKLPKTTLVDFLKFYVSELNYSIQYLILEQFKTISAPLVSCGPTGFATLPLRFLPVPCQRDKTSDLRQNKNTYCQR